MCISCVKGGYNSAVSHCMSTMHCVAMPALNDSFNISVTYSSSVTLTVS